MPQKTVEEFQQEREQLNETVMKYADLTIKRFYGLDAQAYREGALPPKTKEMLGLVASLVLRCDDCIQYHIIRCAEEGVTTDEMAVRPAGRRPNGGRSAGHRPGSRWLYHHSAPAQSASGVG